jgi:hypothetical protein
MLRHSGSRLVPIFNLFSRKKAALSGPPPALQTEQLPDKFRRQVFYILLGAIGKCVEGPRYMPNMDCPSNNAWRFILNAICQEHGLFADENGVTMPTAQVLGFLLRGDTDLALDVIDLSLRYIDCVIRNVGPHQRLSAEDATIPADEAIDDFNSRCRENGVGYSFAGGCIVPMSSAFAQSEVVEPALRLLHDDRFRGAQAEFLKAHKQLRAGNTDGAIVESARAFESTMKVVCDIKGWPYDPRASAKDLIATLNKNGFFPPYLEAQLTHLRCLLETGAPVVRNKDGAHGRGAVVGEAPQALAEYAIHLTAANIVFLVKRFKA